MDTTSLILNLLFGSIGFGFFMYGKRQQAVVPLVCGLILMVFPYFISSNILLAAIGGTLTIIPYFVRL